MSFVFPTFTRFPPSQGQFSRHTQFTHVEIELFLCEHTMAVVADESNTICTTRMSGVDETMANEENCHANGKREMARERKRESRIESEIWYFGREKSHRKWMTTNISSTRIRSDLYIFAQLSHSFFSLSRSDPIANCVNLCVRVYLSVSSLVGVVAVDVVVLAFVLFFICFAVFIDCEHVPIMCAMPERAEASISLFDGIDTDCVIRWASTHRRVIYTRQHCHDAFPSSARCHHRVPNYFVLTVLIHSSLFSMVSGFIFCETREQIINVSHQRRGRRRSRKNNKK